MATYTWIGGVSGLWADASNWSPQGGPPGPGDDVTLDTTAAITGGGDALDITVSASVTLDAGTYRIGDALSFDNSQFGAALTLDGTTLSSATINMPGGSLSLVHHADLTTTDSTTLGTDLLTDSATVTVDDSAWTIGSATDIANLDVGQLYNVTGVAVTVEDDGRIAVSGALDVNVGSLDVTTEGEAAGSTASVQSQSADVEFRADVSGAGATWLAGEETLIGLNGTLTVQDHGVVQSASAEVDDGYFLDAVNADTGVVTDYGGSIGLALSTGATLTTNDTAILGNQGAGAVSVDGQGSDWSIGDNLYAGYMQPGDLSVTNGGSVSAGGLFINTEQYSYDSVVVDGSGSQLSVAGDMVFGVLFSQLGGGNGALIVSGDAVATIGSSATLDTGATIDVGAPGAGGPLGDGSGAVVIGTAAAVAGIVDIGPDGQLVGQGNVIGPTDGEVIGSVFDGGIIASQSGLLTLADAVTGDGALIIEGGGTLELGGSVASGLAISFQSGVGTLRIDDPADFAAGINGFSPGAAITFAPGAATSVAIVGSSLLVQEPGGTTTSIALTGDFATATVTTGSDGSITVAVPCFLAGTPIMTRLGEVAVENLRVGDDVLTCTGEGATFKPIIWIGQTRFDADRHPRPSETVPVRIRAGAIGDGVPNTDLLVSPGHSLQLDGVLIQAERLINGATIFQDHSLRRGEYFHVELARHDTLLSAGVASESYLDVGNRAGFGRSTRLVDLYPDFSPRSHNETCLTLVEDGPTLTSVRSRLLQRAFDLGCRTTHDPDLTVVAGDRSLRTELIAPRRYRVMVPASCRAIRLLSRAFVPSDFDPASFDRRLLGVCVFRIEADGALLPLGGGARFEAGWHDLEHDRDTRWRWTNGDARLATNARSLIIELGGASTFWDDDRPRHERGSSRKRAA